MDNTSNGAEQNKPSPTSVTANDTSNTSQQPDQTMNNEESKYLFDEKTIMASLSYVGPLVLIPFLTKKEDPFIKFHIKQGLILFGLELILMLANVMTFYILWPITSLINIGLVILSIIGILNALQMKEVQIPLLGKYADRIKI